MSEVELTARLEKLERDNRRLKGLGLAALVLVAALGAMAAMRPVPQKMTAHEFDVVDNSGNPHVRMYALKGNARIDLLDARGAVSARLGVSPSGWARIILSDAGKQTVSISGGLPETDRSKVLQAITKAGQKYPGEEQLTRSLQQYFTTSGFFFPGISLTPIRGRTSSVKLAVGDSGEPLIELNDPKGFTMDLGSTSTVIPATGQTQQTSADSIIMFGNDKKHHVIWKAP